MVVGWRIYCREVKKKVGEVSYWGCCSGIGERWWWYVWDGEKCTDVGDMLEVELVGVVDGFNVCGG